MSFLKTILVTVWLGVGSLFGYHPNQQVVQTPVATLGDYNPTGGQTYRLQSSISTTQSTITLTSFKEPVSNIKYTMSYLNSVIEFGTIDPNSSGKEFISFTGITQNNDGTATLTGVSRGLGFSYPFTASTTLASTHSGQAIFIISNPPQLYNQFYNLSNVSTSTNTLIFSSTTPPRYDLVPLNQANGTFVSSTSELASVAYVNKIAIAGASNATEGVTGIVRLATQLQMASTTFAAGTPTALYTLYSTSSPYKSGIWIPITQNDSTLNPNFIATSSFSAPFGYSFTANMTFASTSMTATTSITASSLTNGIFSINAVPLKFPLTQGASSTILTNNGSGTLTWQLPQSRVLYESNTQIQNTSTASTTMVSITLPANTLTVNSLLRITANVDYAAAGLNNFAISLGTGSATTTIAFDRENTGDFNFVSTIVATSTSAQKNVMIKSTTQNNDWYTSASTVGSMFYTPYSTTGLLYISVISKAGGSGIINLEGLSVELLSQ